MAADKHSGKGVDVQIVFISTVIEHSADPMTDPTYAYVNNMYQS